MFFIKKHILKLVIAGVLGIALSLILEKTSEPVYKSYVTVKQNYPTGENLYNSMGYYNDLVDQKDIVTLKNALNIEESEASSILGFDIEPVITENQKLQNFDAYIKTLDSAVASTVEYKAFSENSEDLGKEKRLKRKFMELPTSKYSILLSRLLTSFMSITKILGLGIRFRTSKLWCLS